MWLDLNRWWFADLRRVLISGSRDTFRFGMIISHMRSVDVSLLN